MALRAATTRARFRTPNCLGSRFFHATTIPGRRVMLHHRGWPTEKPTVRATRSSWRYLPSELDFRIRCDTILAATPPPSHKYWGFTIYRCTYGDDAAWSQFIAFLVEVTRETLYRYDAEDLMETLRLTVRDEPLVLGGASKGLIRQRFKDWISSPEAQQERDGTDGHPLLIDGHGTTARYHYRVHVDEESLYSIIDKETKVPKAHANFEGYVNIIDGEWQLPDPDWLADELDDEDDNNNGLPTDPYDEGEEPVEGCKMYDVGWMKVHPGGLMPDYYAHLRGAGENIYARPPYICQW